MSKAEILEELHRMGPAERREIVEQIEEEFADELSPEDITELEKRADELRKNPGTGIAWDEVRAQLRTRLKARRAA